jgi:hypothetical protein
MGWRQKTELVSCFCWYVQIRLLCCDIHHLCSEGNIVFSFFYRLSFEGKAVGYFTWLRQVLPASTRSSRHETSCTGIFLHVQRACVPVCDVTLRPWSDGVRKRQCRAMRIPTNGSFRRQCSNAARGDPAWNIPVPGLWVRILLVACNPSLICVG